MSERAEALRALIERLGWHRHSQHDGKLRLANPDGPEAAANLHALLEVSEAAAALLRALEVETENGIRLRRSMRVRAAMDDLRDLLEEVPHAP